MAKIKLYLVALLISYYSLSAQTWSLPMQVSPIDTTLSGYAIEDQGLTVDRSGRPWCGWGGWQYYPYQHLIYVSHYDTVWSVPDTLHPFVSCDDFNLATDANGNVWVVISDASSGVSAWFYNGISWSGSMQVPTQGTCCHDPVATGDSLGNLWVCWAGGGPGDGHHIWGNAYINGQWGSPVLISYPGSPEEFTYSMITDKQGRVWVGWTCSVWGPNPACFSCASFNDGSGWSDTMVIAENSGQPALTVDTAGRIWAGWVGSDRKVYASYFEDSVWSVPMLVCDSGRCDPRMTSDDRGNVWLAWVLPDTNIMPTSSIIYYSYWNGSKWSDPAPIDTNPALGLRLKMAFDGKRIWATWVRSDPHAVYASYTYGVGVEETPVVNPPQSVSRLHQNYPNPFSSKTSIFYQLQSDCHVSLKIYDIAGNFIKTLVNKNQKAGYYSVNWNGKDNIGTQLPAGIYFLRLQTSNRSITKKIIKLE